MRKLSTMVLALVLMLSMATGAMAKDFSAEADGRNGNSDKNGSFTIVKADGPYYTGGTLLVSVADLVIDGDINTLVITGAGDVALQSTAGEQTIIVTATTYFKNGKKAGLIHTQITASVTITVVDSPSKSCGNVDKNGNVIGNGNGYLNCNKS